MNFTPADHQRVTAAVQLAEKTTSVEIVPVIAVASGRYDRAEDTVGLWCGLIVMSVVWLLWDDAAHRPDEWGGVSPEGLLGGLLVSVIGGFVGGAVLASRWPPLRRLFTPRVQMIAEVDRRARSVFFDQRVHHTAGASGLLIYVSLYEHRAVILADQQVTELLGQAALEGACAELTGQIATGESLIDALCQTIAGLGKELAAVLPHGPENPNELSDALVVIE